jgi:purine-binding chemotaxis protein CheW
MSLAATQPVDLKTSMPLGADASPQHAKTKTAEGAAARSSNDLETDVERGRRRERGGKFLTFFLADEEYGLEILKVHEIIGMMSITRVPRTPAFVRGVINLRGKVIPVMDLRLKFGMPPQEPTDETCIIVVQVQHIEMGILVDKVSEVLDIAAKDIDDVPSFGSEVNTDYILGIGKSQNRVKLLLDIDKVLSRQEVINLRSASTQHPEQTK